jgi:predicted RNA-binding Zn ribbon-like protein
MTHDHPAALDDGLDFVNTLEHSADGDTDALASLELALAWLVERRLLHADDAARLLEPDSAPAAGAQSPLERVRIVRAGLRDAWDAAVEGRPANPAALEPVNDVLATRETPTIEVAPDGVRVGHRHGGDPLDEALGRTAETIVAELASGSPDRLRICANDACRWVFRDASPTGRRRWCSMASCGNRAKAARHRARRREPQSERLNGG